MQICFQNFMGNAVKRLRQIHYKYSYIFFFISIYSIYFSVLGGHVVHYNLFENYINKGKVHAINRRNLLNISLSNILEIEGNILIGL